MPPPSTSSSPSPLNTSPNLLPHTVSGRPPAPGTPVLVFLPGYPDDCGSFQLVAAHFQATHTVVQACWPGYEAKHPRFGTGGLTQRFGHPFAEVVERCAATIETMTSAAAAAVDAVDADADGGRGSGGGGRNSGSGGDIREEGGCGKARVRVTLVAHDWGAYLAYRLCALRPDLLGGQGGQGGCGGLVALDVGHLNPVHLVTRNPIAALVIVAYQLWLVVCFLASQLLHPALGDALLVVYPWTLWGPCPDEHALPRALPEVHAWMGYPYFNLWVRSLWTGGPPALAFPPSVGVPLLYCYGAKKRALFHTPDFLARIDGARKDAHGGGAGANAAVARAGAASRWVELPGSGHWMHTQQPDRIIQEIEAFLGTLDDETSPKHGK